MNAQRATIHIVDDDDSFRRAEQRMACEKTRRYRECFEGLTPREREVFERVIASKASYTAHLTVVYFSSCPPGNRYLTLFCS